MTDDFRPWFMRVQNLKALVQLLHPKLAWTKYPISSGTDRQTDRRTDRRTDGQTDGQAQPYIPSFSRGINSVILSIWCKGAEVVGVKNQGPKCLLKGAEVSFARGRSVFSRGAEVSWRGAEVPFPKRAEVSNRGRSGRGRSVQNSEEALNLSMIIHFLQTTCLIKEIIQDIWGMW